MIEQYLSNTNENVIILILQFFLELNKAILVFSCSTVASKLDIETHLGSAADRVH